MSEEIKGLLREYIVEKPVDVIEKGFFGKYIDVYLIRKVVGSIIFRNTDRTELTYTSLNGRTHVEVYSRKFKAPEKLTGLKILKRFGKLPEGYLYNAVSNNEALKNPVSVLYGDSVTETERGAQIPSRILYSWALSVEEFHQVAEEKTHNALSEMGTMWEAGKYKQTLFKNIYMKRGHLIQLVSFYNVSLEELIFGLGNILYTHTYGAEDSVNPRNIENEILAIVLSSPFEPPITPYTLVEKMYSNRKTNEIQEPKKVLKDILNDEVKKYPFATLLQDDRLGDLVKAVTDIFGNDKKMEEFIEKLSKDSSEFVSKLTEKKGRERRKK
jgi:CRISPR-associated protein Csc2